MVSMGISKISGEGSNPSGPAKHSEKCIKWFESRFGKSDNPLYCLGVLYSCGHTFDCMWSDEAVNHDCHKWSNRINAILFILAWIGFMLVLIFPKGIFYHN